MKEAMELDIEALMHKLENEKRESDYLDDLIKNLESSISSFKSAKRKESPLKNPLLTRATLIEKQIEHETASYDALKSENFKTRREIDQLRLENNAWKKSLLGLKNLIQTSSSRAVQMSELSSAKLSITRANESKITSIRSRSVLSKIEYGEKVRNMSRIIREKSSLSFHTNKNMRLEELIANVSGCNVHKIQKELQKRWTGALKSKRNELDSYHKHILRLKESFEQIRIAFGIANLNDIVTISIKTDEQNQSLYQYLSNLNSNIDEVEEKLKQNMAKIKSLQVNDSTEERQMKKLLEIKKEQELIKEKTESANIKGAEYEIKIEKAFGRLEGVMQRCSLFDKKVEFDEEKSYETLRKSLKITDEIIETIKAALKGSSNRTTREWEKNGLVIQGGLMGLFEHKDIYDDQDIEENKMPMQKEEFIEKAFKILGNSN